MKDGTDDAGVPGKHEGGQAGVRRQKAKGESPAAIAERSRRGVEPLSRL